MIYLHALIRTSLNEQSDYSLMNPPKILRLDDTVFQLRFTIADFDADELNVKSTQYRFVLPR